MYTCRLGDGKSILIDMFADAIEAVFLGLDFILYSLSLTLGSKQTVFCCDFLVFFRKAEGRDDLTAFSRLGSAACIVAGRRDFGVFSAVVTRFTMSACSDDSDFISVRL